MPEMLDDISYLSQEIGPRPAGTEEEQQAALYIAEQMQKRTGFTANIEDFSCASSAGIIEPICFGLPALFALLAMVNGAFAIPALLVSLVCAVLFGLEVFDKPVLSRAMERGVSQNVVAKYTPGTGSSARTRKIVIVAGYDSGKVRRELSGALGGAWPFLRKGSIVALCALVVIWLLRCLFFADGVGGAVQILNLLNALCVILTAIPVVMFFLQRTAAYNEAANHNASGVAVMMRVAERIAGGMLSEEELQMRKGDEAEDAPAEGRAPVAAPGRIHGEEAVRAAGLVPEDVVIEYSPEAQAAIEASAESKPAEAADGVEPDEVEQPGEPAEPAEPTAKDRLASAKGAIAALTGKPVREYMPEPVPEVFETPEDAEFFGQDDFEYDENADYGEFAYQEGDDIAYDQNGDPREESAFVPVAAPAMPMMAPAAEAAALADAPAGDQLQSPVHDVSRYAQQQGRYAGTYREQTPAGINYGSGGVPDWYRKAQERARHVDDDRPARRSRYADALDAALATSSDHFAEANAVVSLEAGDRLSQLREEISNAKAPTLADVEERLALEDDQAHEMAVDEQAPYEQVAEEASAVEGQAPSAVEEAPVPGTEEAPEAADAQADELDYEEPAVAQWPAAWRQDEPAVQIEPLPEPAPAGEVEPLPMEPLAATEAEPAAAPVEAEAPEARRVVVDAEAEAVDEVEDAAVAADEAEDVAPEADEPEAAVEDDYAAEEAESEAEEAAFDQDQAPEEEDYEPWVAAFFDRPADEDDDEEPLATYDTRTRRERARADADEASQGGAVEAIGEKISGWGTNLANRFSQWRAQFSAEREYDYEDEDDESAAYNEPYGEDEYADSAEWDAQEDWQEDGEQAAEQDWESDDQAAEAEWQDGEQAEDAYWQTSDQDAEPAWQASDQDAEADWQTADQAAEPVWQPAENEDASWQASEDESPAWQAEGQVEEAWEGFEEEGQPELEPEATDEAEAEDAWAPYEQDDEQLADDQEDQQAFDAAWNFAQPTQDAYDEEAEAEVQDEPILEVTEDAWEADDQQASDQYGYYDSDETEYDYDQDEFGQPRSEGGFAERISQGWARLKEAAAAKREEFERKAETWGGDADAAEDESEGPSSFEEAYGYDGTDWPDEPEDYDQDEAWDQQPAAYDDQTQDDAADGYAEQEDAWGQPAGFDAQDRFANDDESEPDPAFDALEAGEEEVEAEAEEDAYMRPAGSYYTEQETAVETYEVEAVAYEEDDDQADYSEAPGQGDSWLDQQLNRHDAEQEAWQQQYYGEEEDWADQDEADEEHWEQAWRADGFGSQEPEQRGFFQSLKDFASRIMSDRDEDDREEYDYDEDDYEDDYEESLGRGDDEGSYDGYDEDSYNEEPYEDGSYDEDAYQPAAYEEAEPADVEGEKEEGLPRYEADENPFAAQADFEASEEDEASKPFAPAWRTEAAEAPEPGPWSRSIPMQVSEPEAAPVPVPEPEYASTEGEQPVTLEGDEAQELPRFDAYEPQPEVQGEPDHIRAEDPVPVVQFEPEAEPPASYEVEAAAAELPEVDVPARFELPPVDAQIESKKVAEQETVFMGGAAPDMTTSMPPIDVSSLREKARRARESAQSFFQAPNEQPDPFAEEIEVTFASQNPSVAPEVPTAEVEPEFEPEVEAQSPFAFEPEPMPASAPAVPAVELDSIPESAFGSAFEPVLEPEPMAIPVAAPAVPAVELDPASEPEAQAEPESKASTRARHASHSKPEAAQVDGPQAAQAAGSDDAPQAAERPERGSHRKQPTVARSSIADIPTVGLEARQQPAPLAEDYSSRRLESGRIPRIDLSPNAPMPPVAPEGDGAAEVIEMAANRRAALRDSLPSLSGAFGPIEVDNETVSKTGSFAPVGATGAFAPVGDELIADLDPNDIYVDDADDSDYDEHVTQTGAFAGPGYVEMPESRASRFFGRFRKRDEEETSMSGWLDVDEGFNPTEVGKERGGWESFAEGSDYKPRTRGADTRNPDDDDWNGGAYGPDSAEQRTDDKIAEEARMVYSFRNPDVNTEVWFVALGSEQAANGGMRAFMREHAQELRGSIIINLESLGAGHLSYVSKEGIFQPRKPSSRLKRYLRKAAEITGLHLNDAAIDWRESPATIALRNGLQGMTIAGMDGSIPADMNQGDDVVENIDAQQLEQAADFILEVVKSV